MTAEVVKASPCTALCKYGITNKERDTELSAALGDPIAVISSMDLDFIVMFTGCQTNRRDDSSSFSERRRILGC